MTDAYMSPTQQLPCPAQPGLSPAPCKRSDRPVVDLDPAGPSVYDHTTADGFRMSMDSQRELLPEPYFDKAGTDAWLVTVYVPMSDGEGKVGVTAADMDAPRSPGYALCR